MDNFRTIIAMQVAPPDYQILYILEGGWDHLAPLQVLFQVGGHPKMAIFGAKMDHDGRLPYQSNNPPGNWLMGKTLP